MVFENQLKSAKGIKALWETHGDVRVGQAYLPE